METFAPPSSSAFEDTIYEFAQNGGVFIALTADSGFIKTIRTALHQGAGVSRNSLHTLSSVDKFFALLKKNTAKKCVICLERIIGGRNAGQVLEHIKNVCSDAGIIVLTTELDQFTTALLVEQGASNIITKPISIASLTEKIAFAIAPQGKLGKLIDKGKKCLESEAWGDALQVADDILALKRDSAVGYMLKGDAYKGLEMTSKAEEMYLRASESAELYLAPLKRLAELHEDSGNFDKQLSFLHKLNEISPLNTQRIVQIGEIEIARGNSEEAEAMFQRAMDMAEREARDIISTLSSKIADICVRRNPGMAVKYSKRALDIKGDALGLEDIATVTILGISLRKQGKWREAIAEYRRVLNILTDNPALMYNMALAYSEGKEHSKAYVLVRKALELDPGLPESGKNVAYNIGKIFEKANQNPVAFFKRAYQQDPNDTVLWQALKKAQQTADALVDQA